MSSHTAGGCSGRPCSFTRPHRPSAPATHLDSTRAEVTMPRFGTAAAAQHCLPVICRWRPALNVLFLGLPGFRRAARLAPSVIVDGCGLAAFQCVNPVSRVVKQRRAFRFGILRARTFEGVPEDRVGTRGLVHCPGSDWSPARAGVRVRSDRYLVALRMLDSPIEIAFKAIVGVANSL